MTDTQARLEDEEITISVCSNCGKEEPVCDGANCKDRDFQDGEHFVCVDDGDFHFCKKCSKLKASQGSQDEAKKE